MKNSYTSILFLILSLFFSIGSYANVPGGGSGAGPDVTVTSTSTTITLKNGIVSVTINKASAMVTNYTFNNTNLLAGGYRGGQLYWSSMSPGGGVCELTADPSTNGGNYAEVRFRKIWKGDSLSVPLDLDVYYSLPRGTQGLYATAILTHQNNYPSANTGEWRMAGYVGATFNWLSVDSLRNKQIPYYNGGDSSTSVPWGGAPKEVTRWLSGIYANKYECKYDYSADFGTTDVWGWSSTTKNLGIWITAPSKEYYNGGPMKRELTCHVGPTILNMLNGGHYGMGDSYVGDSGVYSQKVYGPFLIYCNSVPAGTPQAWKALWEDAKAQAKAEQNAWPFTWFTNPAYKHDSSRGVVKGHLVINDTNPNISAANNWVGLSRSQTGVPVKEFQLFGTPYEFWAKTDSAGYFIIPHVIADSGYNFYAFGPGCAGQLTKASFVKMNAGDTLNLGDVIWTPDRIAPTVWEIGIPDRNATEFFHGNDWFTSNTYPDSNWAIFMNYPREFPNDVNYTIGSSNWTKDWNFVQNYDNRYYKTAPVWKVNFNLTNAPTGSNASLYVAVAAANSAGFIVFVNGNRITKATTGTYFPNYSDAMIRKGIHGAFGDVRLTFPAKYLKAGNNQITLSLRITGGGTDGDIMYDYLRLEASGTSISNPLPIKFLPLSVNKENTFAVLHWATVAEQNNDHFEVERSANGSVFSNVNSIMAKGNSTTLTEYSFTDIQPLVGTSYYRIKQVDKDGKFAYGNVVTLNTTNSNSLKLYPNPAKGNVTLSFSAKQAGILMANIIDANGIVVKEIKINAVVGLNNNQIDVCGLNSGSYTIVLRNKLQSITSKFVKL